MQLTIEITDGRQAYEVWIALYNRALDLDAAHDTHPRSGFDEKAAYVRSLADVVKPLKIGGEYAVGKGSAREVERSRSSDVHTKRSRKGRRSRRVQ